MVTMLEVSENSDPDQMLRVTLSQQGALDWPAMADWLAARTVAGLETVTAPDGPIFRRTAVIDGQTAMIEIGPATVTGNATGIGTGADASADDNAPGVKQPNGQGIDLRVHFRGPRGPAHPRTRANRMIGSHLAIDQAASHLRDDAVLAPLIEARPGLRPPGCWDPYETTVRAVFAQQITMTAARTIAGRIVERFGAPVHGFERFGLDRLFPDPTVLARADLEGSGLTRTRAATVATVARAAADGFDFAAPDLVTRMTELRGIGPWTASYVAMRMGEPDVFPASDIALREAVGRLTGTERPSTRELTELSQQWRPWRSVAAIHLWYSLRDPLTPKIH